MNEKDCGSQKVERVVHNGIKAYMVTEVIGSYSGQAINCVTFYTRKNPIFDYTVEDVL
jgi:hypothetical protein